MISPFALPLDDPTARGCSIRARWRSWDAAQNQRHASLPPTHPYETPNIYTCPVKHQFNPFKKWFNSVNGNQLCSRISLNKSYIGIPSCFKIVAWLYKDNCSPDENVEFLTTQKLGRCEKRSIKSSRRRIKCFLNILTTAFRFLPRTRFCMYIICIITKIMKTICELFYGKCIRQKCIRHTRSKAR